MLISLVSKKEHILDVLRNIIKHNSTVISPTPKKEEVFSQSINLVNKIYYNTNDTSFLCCHMRRTYDVITKSTTGVRSLLYYCKY